MWWYMPVISALKKLRQWEGHQFEVNLSYLVITFFMPLTKIIISKLIEMY
jgi:hypothetical protein